MLTKNRRILNIHVVSQGIESDSSRKPSAREACALTTMPHRPLSYETVRKLNFALSMQYLLFYFTLVCFMRKRDIESLNMLLRF